MDRRGRRAARQAVRWGTALPAKSLRLVAPSERAEPLPERDVWRWTSRKYRIRTVVLLLINAVLFTGLAVFTLWLRTGTLGPFSGESYWEAWWRVFDPTLEEQVTLIDFLLGPIPVSQVPMMMIIVGLVLASMTAIPILVSMLYRFPFSLIFTAIIGFVALFPWLALTTTFCCFLARWKPLRFHFRFATALLSMLPLVVYYALATRNAHVAAHLPPVEMAKLYIPWVLALTCACVLMGLVLAIARLVNDRPGAIAPCMAVMFAIPVGLFEWKVGRDELYYRLLEAEYGPGSIKAFVDDVDARATIERIARRLNEAAGDRRPSLQAQMEQVRFAMQLQMATAQVDWPREVRFEGLLREEALAARQHDAVEACRGFRHKYPGSRYDANVLYVWGRSLDKRMDQELFRRSGILRYYEEFPSSASREPWQLLVTSHPESPLSSVGLYRLALLEGRAGEVTAAVALLDRLVGRFAAGGEEPVEPRPVRLLSKQPAASTLGVRPAAAAVQGARLRELLAQNGEPQIANLPLRELLSMDPRHLRYQANLRRLLAEIDAKYPGSPLQDNLEVLIAAAEPSRSLRIESLRACIERLARQPSGDALPQARFELAVAYQVDNRPAEARSLLLEIVQQHGASTWAEEARRRLAEMQTGVGAEA